MFPLGTDTQSESDGKQINLGLPGAVVTGVSVIARELTQFAG